MMPSKGYRTVSMKIKLLDRLQKLADLKGESRSEVIHRVLWAYVEMQGVM